MKLLQPEHFQLFKGYLRSLGAEVLPATNEFEILRFRTIGGVGVSVLYRRKNGSQTGTGEMELAIDGFYKRRAWTPGVPRALPRRKQLSHRIKVLRDRDGDACFYCGLALVFDDRDDFRIEHLVPRSHGGPDHVSNLALTHTLCEMKAGTLSAAEKVRLRDGLRAAASRRLILE